MFMLIIWLQGIWLPEHGVGFASTPLWAGIRMLPLTIGFLIAGPISGILSDRYGARPFATGGMLVSALSFFLLAMLPVDFSYAQLAAILLLMGLSMGAFASPNRAGVMNSLPAQHRGAGGGMNQTFQNSAQVLSIGIFFTLMIVGLSATLPHSLAAGLQAHGVPPHVAARVSKLPPVSVLFAAFLGYNPAQKLLGPHVLARLPAAQRGGDPRARVLPPSDRGAVPQRSPRGVRVRDRGLPRRGARLLVARRPRGRARGARTRASRRAGRLSGATGYACAAICTTTNAA